MLVQWPKTFDTACSLALLQEEVAGPSTSSTRRHGDWSSSSRTTKGPLPLPPPPQRAERSAALPGTRAISAAATPESRLAALKNQRRTLGLCFKCGKKWSRDHRCPPDVLLAVESIWDAFQDTDTSEPSSPSGAEAQLFLAISKAAIQGVQSARTIQFQGSILGLSVLVLIDSGSSASFTSESVAARLSGISVEPVLSSVQVAGGTLLSSNSVLRQAPWSIGHCVFATDLRVLPLKAFDIIIGMDWLEAHSPMLVD